MIVANNMHFVLSSFRVKSFLSLEFLVCLLRVMCEYIDSIELRNLAQIGTWPLLPAGGGHLISMETLHLLKCVWVEECICDVHYCTM